MKHNEAKFPISDHIDMGAIIFSGDVALLHEIRVKPCILEAALEFLKSANVCYCSHMINSSEINREGY